MNTPAQITASQTRMAVQAYQLRAVADTFTRFGPGTPAYANCLASYYAETIHLLYDAHQKECSAVDGDCQTCNAIRTGLTGVGADLLVTRRLARLANRLKAQL